MTKLQTKVGMGLGAFLLVGLFLHNAQAAQWARVTVDSVVVYDGPTKKHRVQRSAKRGMVMQASNYPTEGYYKVRLQDGTVGWIIGSALLLKGPAISTSETVPAKQSSSVPAAAADELPPPLPDQAPQP